MALTKGRPRDRDPADTVATTWQVSLERVRPVPGAVALLEVCAFLSPEEIPRELFAAQLDPPAEAIGILAEDPFALDEAIGALHRFGLLKASEQTLVVHRLLQHVIRDQLDLATASNRAGAAVRLLAAAFPTEGFTDPGVWPQCEQLLPHTLAAANHAEHYKVEPAATSDLLDSAESYLDGRGRYAEARTLAERALTLAEAAFGPEHQTIPRLINNLANVLHGQGDLHGARTHHERALTIYEARLGPDHPTTAQSLNNLANVLHAQGDLHGARTHHERALTIREARLGPDHPTTAQSLDNLANVLADQGDLAAAKAVYERLLAIVEGVLGPDDVQVAVGLYKLAGVLQALNDLPAAREKLERAAAIDGAAHGADHPEVATDLTPSPASWPPRATSKALAPSTSAPWQSARPAWAPTTPTRCEAASTLRWC